MSNNSGSMRTKLTKKRKRNEINDAGSNRANKRAKGPNGEIVPIFQRQFEKNELVVTKVRGWSAWPAKVMSTNVFGRKYEVQYYGFPNMTGLVGAKEIFHFDDQSIAMLAEVATTKPNLNGYTKSLREVVVTYNYSFPFEIPK